MSQSPISKAAEEDIFEIIEYIARSSEDAAERVREDICDAITLLSEMPGLGHTREALTDKPFRFWLVHSYLTIYGIEGPAIHIVRVLSAHRDVSTVLREST